MGVIAVRVGKRRNKRKEREKEEEEERLNAKKNT